MSTLETFVNSCELQDKWIGCDDYNLGCYRYTSTKDNKLIILEISQTSYSQ